MNDRDQILDQIQIFFFFIASKGSTILGVGAKSGIRTDASSDEWEIN